MLETGNKKTLITVIVPVFDRKEFLSEALISLKMQSLSKEFFEVIVVKNFVDNELDNIINAMGYDSALCLGNMGERLSVGLESANGEIISFLQDDDIFEANKLEEIVKLFSGSQKIGYIYNGYTKIDSIGDLINPKEYSNSEQIEIFDPCSNKEILRLLVKDHYDFNLSCISIKKEIVLEYQNILRKIVGADDSFMFFIAALSCYSILVTKSNLTKYRVHNSATIKNGTIENMLLNNSLTFGRQIRTFNLLKDEFQNTFLEDVLRDGLISRIAAKNIVELNELRRSELFQNALNLIRHHNTINKGYFLKLLFGSAVVLINQSVTNIFYYVYIKIRF